MTTRGRPKRSQETRQAEFSYKPPMALDVPDELVKFFDKEGYHLRWIRWMINGMEDVKNITYRLREGYEFINRLEIPEEFRDWFEVNKIRTFNQAICVNDLALGKILKSKAQARREYTEGLSEKQVKAARREADKVSDQRMNTMTPIIDESETEVEIST